jgi:hypothetical protein
VQKQTKYHRELKEVLLSRIIDLPLHEAKWQGSTPKEERHRKRYQGQPRLKLEYPSSPLVGASFQMVDPPPKISLLSL